MDAFFSRETGRPRVRAGIVLFAGALALGLDWTGARAQGREVLQDRGDGTILDVRTKLLWRKCGYGQRYGRDRCSGLSKRLDLREAARYCAALSSKTRTWRLPTIEELNGITLSGDERPAIDLRRFPGTAPLEYWSRSAYVDEAGAWTYVFSFSRNYRFAVRQGSYFVRCVSGSPAADAAGDP